MSGKFTGLNYDEKAYIERLRQSTKPLEYYLNPNYAEHCQTCFPPNNIQGGSTIPLNDKRRADIIDVDSLLKGIGKISSKASDQQQNQPISSYRNNLTRCPVRLESENTRYLDPTYNLREKPFRGMNLDFPLHDPQCAAVIPQNFGVNTRMQAKDDHIPTWQIPMDQTNVLPSKPKNNKKICTTTFNCGPFNL